MKDCKRITSPQNAYFSIALGFLCIILQSKQVASLSLNPIESSLLKSRLSKIQDATRDELKVSAPLFPEQGDGEKFQMPCIIFPGAGGPDSLTAELNDAIPNSRVWDWSEHRGSLVTAAFDGEAVGEIVGQVYLEQCKNSGKESNSDIHVVGISVGAFCANAMTRTLRATATDNGTKLRIWMTLLDPFTQRGAWGFNYGVKNFGVEADYAEQYLNTDDPVPTTNEALPNCYCVDVTGCPERNNFQVPEGDSMHSWPAAYYARFGYQEVTSSGNGFPQHGERYRARGTTLTL